MQTWRVFNSSGSPVPLNIQGEDLVSAMARHRDALLAVAFPQGIQEVDRAWMHWEPTLLDGRGGVEILVTGLRDGAEREGRVIIEATPGEIAPDTGRPVFF